MARLISQIHEKWVMQCKPLGLLMFSVCHENAVLQSHGCLIWAFCATVWKSFLKLFLRAYLKAIAVLEVQAGHRCNVRRLIIFLAFYFCFSFIVCSLMLLGQCENEKVTIVLRLDVWSLFQSICFVADFLKLFSVAVLFNRCSVVGNCLFSPM